MVICWRKAPSHCRYNNCIVFTPSMLKVDNKPGTIDPLQLCHHICIHPLQLHHQFRILRLVLPSWCTIIQALTCCGDLNQSYTTTVYIRSYLLVYSSISFQSCYLLVHQHGSCFLFSFAYFHILNSCSIQVVTTQDGKSPRSCVEFC